MSDNTDRNIAIGFIVMWILGALGTIAFWCFIVWAIYRVVIAYT